MVRDRREGRKILLEAQSMQRTIALGKWKKIRVHT